MKAFLSGSILAFSLAGTAFAAQVNGTGMVTPDIIFGSGNANGSFTGNTQNNIEVGLRAKLRYNASGLPENTFNYDGVDTYSFTPTAATPTNRSVFNFEWSINVDQSGSSGAHLSDFDYRLSVDQDASILTSFVSTDPFNNFVYVDHAFGDNSTPNGGGTAGTFLTIGSLAANNSVAQQSTNMGFNYALFTPWLADPDANGIYDIVLEVLSPGTTDVLSESSIRVYAGVLPPPPPIPLPAALPMLASALAVAGLIRRRRKA